MPSIDYSVLQQQYANLHQINVANAKAQMSTPPVKITAVPRSDLKFEKRGVSNMSSGLRSILSGAGAALGAASGNNLNPEIKFTREGIRGAIGQMGPWGAIISAASGVVDTIGDITGLNLAQLDKTSAERAGVSTVGNDLMNMLPGNSMIWGAMTKKTKDAQKSMEVDKLAGSYGGTVADINAAQDLGGIRILFGRKKANKFIDQQNLRNAMMTELSIKDREKRAGAAMANNYQNQNMINYGGGRQQMAIGKRGMKLPALYEIRRLLEIKKFQAGGKMNVIVEGAYHSRKNHLSDLKPELEDVTPKGIPVITKEEGGEIIQTAEVEQKEMILHLELTQRLEELYQDGSEEAMIEAGKILAEEIINNTDDKTGEVLNNGTDGN